MPIVDNLPINVLVAIRQSLGAKDGEDTSKDHFIERMPAKELFRAYCEWEGLTSWPDTLVFAWEKINEAKQGLSDRQYIRVLEDLLETRDQLLKAIPECPEHGANCVPHALEWIEEATAENEQIKG